MPLDTSEKPVYTSIVHAFGSRFPFASELEKDIPVMFETLAKNRFGEKVGYGIAVYLIRLK